MLDSLDVENMLFFEYFPGEKLRNFTSNKISSILSKDYLNLWKEYYELDIDFDDELILIENKKISLNYSILAFKKDGSEYFVDYIENKTNIPGLGVIMMNILKMNLKRGEFIRLFDDSKHKITGKSLRGYYKKQGFKGFWNDLKFKKNKNERKTESNFLNLSFMSWKNNNYK